MEKLAELGVIHGRFQPLHIGHLEYLLAGKARCRHLIVGITNPDPAMIVEEATDDHRHLAEANPYTFYQRLRMVEGALVEAGVPRRDFSVVPFPHGQMDRLFFYAPRDALYFTSIYDAWGHTKLGRFEEAGLTVCNLWTRRHKITSSSEIRGLIRQGLNWRTLVPRSVAELISRIDPPAPGISRKVQ